MKIKLSLRSLERSFQPVVIIAFLMLLLFLVTLVTIQLNLGGFGDVEVFSKYYASVSAGHLPYAGLHIEYPPGGVFMIILAGWLTHFFIYYETAFEVLTVLALATVLYHVIVRKGWKSLVGFVLVLLPLLQFTFFELDTFAAVSLYFSLWQFRQKRFGWSAILLAIATLIKAYPGVAVVGLFWLVPKDKRKLFAAAFLGSLAVVLLPLTIIVPHGLWYSFTYHTGRPLEILSGAAVVGFVGHIFGLSAHLFTSHKSRNIGFPHDNLVGSLVTLCLAVGLTALSWLTAKGWWKQKPVLLSMALLITFILFFKVGSPQYLLVPVMLLPLVRDELPAKLYSRLTLNFLLASLVIWLQFPFFFYETKAFNTGGWAWAFALFSLAKIAVLVNLLVFLIKKRQTKV